MFDQCNKHRNAYSHQTIGDMKVLLCQNIYDDNGIGLNMFVNMLNQQDGIVVEQCVNRNINLRIKKSKKNMNGVIHTIIYQTYYQYLILNKSHINSYISKSDNMNSTLEQFLNSYSSNSLINLFQLSDTQIILKL